ncbi:hypothetical protein D3C84_658540 [compost metagenome]
MQAARDHFLAAAGFPAQQDIHRGAGQLQDLAAQVQHGPGHAEQAAVELVLEVDLHAQAAVLLYQAAFLQGAAQALQQPLGGEGLFDEVIGAQAHGLHRLWHVAVAGDHQEGQLAVDGLHGLEQGHAIHAGHAQVADDHAREVGIEALQAVLGTGFHPHLEAGKFQPLAYGFADGRLVVDEDHLGCHGYSSLALSTGRRRLNTAPSPWLAAARLPPSSWTMA